MPIRIVIPFHLRTLARVEGEVAIDVDAAAGPATIGMALDALETKHPMLRGTIRDHVTKQRRPFIRFFACNRDFSNDAPSVELPEDVQSGKEPLMVVGAIAGG